LFRGLRHGVIAKAPPQSDRLEFTRLWWIS